MLEVLIRSAPGITGWCEDPKQSSKLNQIIVVSQRHIHLVKLAKLNGFTIIQNHEVKDKPTAAEPHPQKYLHTTNAYIRIHSNKSVDMLIIDPMEGLLQKVEKLGDSILQTTIVQFL